MNRVIKGITKLIGLIFFSIGLFGILSYWNEAGYFSWSGLVFLILGVGFYGLSYAFGADFFLGHAPDECDEEGEENDQ